LLIIFFQKVNKWSLEDLELYLEFEATSSESSLQNFVIVENLLLEGAKVSSQNSALVLCDELHASLPLSVLKWRLKSGEKKENVVSFPLYLNENRKILIAQVLMETPVDVPKHVWSQRGVALVLQSNAI
jgi:hypothetical protein